MEKQRSQTEIENYLISAIFSGDELFDIFNKSVEAGVTSESFTSAVNAEVWSAIEKVKGRGELVEEANVVVELAKDSTCGIDYRDILNYSEFISSPSQWSGFSTALVRNEILRKLSREFRIGLESVQENEDPEKIISSIQKGIDNIESVGSEELDISDIASLVYDNLLNPDKPKKEYLPTGLSEYDSTLKGNGFGSGQLCVVAARPALGKTTIAINFAMHNARMGNGVGIVSLEMDEEELGEKLATIESQVPSKLLEEGVASLEQQSKMNKALAKIKKLPIHIDCRSRSLPQIISKCKIWVKKNKVKMVIIDYCQLIRGSKNLPREQQIAEISRELKLLASDLKIPIVLIAQLNREVEKNDRRPIMSDLRESGALEQDANSITFLYLKEEDRVHGDPEYVRWYRAKQRAGQTAEGLFGFKRHLGIFTSYTSNPDLLP